MKINLPTKKQLEEFIITVGNFITPPSAMDRKKIFKKDSKDILAQCIRAILLSRASRKNRHTTENNGLKALDSYRDSQGQRPRPGEG